jgi:hypothetical protein
MTAAEQFWYVLQCIAFGAGYFAKVPVKKALSEVGLAQMTGAELVCTAVHRVRRRVLRQGASEEGAERNVTGAHLGPVRCPGGYHCSAADR